MPERPLAGQQVRAVYRASKTLGDEPSLVLRARLRTSEDFSYQRLASQTIALLERQRDGSYGGTFTLPDGVVYAAFAVEDRSATRTDSRDGRFWEILAGDDEGRPLIDSLEQRAHDHTGRDSRAVLETAREMTRLYPDKPRAWGYLRFSEGMVLDAEAVEQRLASYRERLHALDRALAHRPDVDPDDVGYMYVEARVIGEEELAVRWREKLLAQHPGNFFAIQERIAELHHQHGDDTASILGGLEALWEIAEGRRIRTRLAETAFRAALAHGEAPTTYVWADRYSKISPFSRGSVAAALSSAEATREEGIRRLQNVISHYQEPADDERAIGATAAAHREQTTQGTASLRHWLGLALLAADRTDEALSALEQSSAVGWSTGRFRSLGNARLAAGDQEGATRAFAFAAADPATSAETIDSMRTAVGLEPGPWSAAVARAREEMLARTMQSAGSETLSPVTLMTSDESKVRLESVVDGAPTLVMFWSRYCAPSAQAMPRVAELATRLANDGMRLIAVTRDSPEEAKTFLQEAGLDIPVYFDRDREAAEALNSWGTPQYFVLDGAGRLRFAFSSLGEVQRQLAALAAHEHSARP